MAAKSITTASGADAAMAALSEIGVVVDRATIQNGYRIRLTMQGRLVGLNVYPSKDGGCKVVFDRADTAEADAIASHLHGTGSPAAMKKTAAGAIAPAVEAAAWVGSDESGKGDYLGPLVVAAIAVTREGWPVLRELGVRDSKSLADREALDLAGRLREGYPCEIITIMPPRYNELWKQFGTVNRLLAWAHARAIENVLERAPGVTAVVADQFGDESLIRDALFRRGRDVRLWQMHRAEADPAVAAASILARAEFLRRLASLSRATGVQLPKGASPTVDAAARQAVALRGEAVLDRIAKRHFKNTARVLRQAKGAAG
jgi:ribonuclease HIII